MIGTTVLITDLAKLEEDLIVALKPLLPAIHSLCPNDKHWITGTDLPMFWRDRRFQVNLCLNSRQVNYCSDEDLNNLGFVKSSVEAGICFSHSPDSSFWNRLSEALDTDENNAYLRLFLSFSNNREDRWNDVWKRSSNYEIEVKEYHRAFPLMSDNRYKDLEGCKLFCLELSKRFFPREMYVLNACLTNWPSSEIWQFQKSFA